MPVQVVHDISLHYQHFKPFTPTGKTPMLLLSGMASDSASWQPVLAGLQKHYELFVPDNRCTGQTTPNPVQTNRGLMVNDVLALLDALEIEKVTVLGHSMGGMLGWALAAKAPDRVEHLVAVAALPNVIPARLALFKSLSHLRFEESETEWFKLLYHFLFCPDFFNDPEAVTAAALASQAYPYKQDARSFAAQVSALESFLSAPAIENIDCPIDLITGSHDILTTPKMLADFASSNPQVKTHTIQDAAHALHWEQSEAFIECVLGVLNYSCP